MAGGVKEGSTLGEIEAGLAPIGGDELGDSKLQLQRRLQRFLQTAEFRKKPCEP